ncbi:hypothetical protein GGF31_000364 [Allomyces arbusculus]|nr:hypothetical protein GGF31_000364 [Allomyces arbusculus]
MMTGSAAANAGTDPDHGPPAQSRVAMPAEPARGAVARPVLDLPEVQVNGATAPSAESWPAHLDNDPDVGPTSPQWHAAPSGAVPPIQQSRRDVGATSLVELAESEIERDGDVRLTSVPFPDRDNYTDELPPDNAQQHQGADKAGSTLAASSPSAHRSSDRPTAKPETEHAPKTEVKSHAVKSYCAAPMATDPRKCGYLPIENYGIIGNMRTAALIGTDASIDFMCFPRFDSPSVFCRLLDHHKGGYFQIAPKQQASRKQQYLPNSNVLVTRFLADEGASQVTDFFHVPEKDPIPASGSASVSAQPTSGTAAYGASHHSNQGRVLYPWVIRIVEAVRGTVTFDALCFPAFRYALDAHSTHIEPGCDESDDDDDDLDDLERDRATVGSRDEIMYARTSNATVVFTSPTLTMDLRHVVMNPCCDDATAMAPLPRIRWETEEREELKGPGVKATFTLHEGQQVWFVFRERPKVHEDGDTVSAHPSAAASASVMHDNVTRPASPALAAPVVTKLWSAHPAPCDTNGSAGDVAASANNRVTGPLGCGLDPSMNRPVSPFPLDMHSVLRSDESDSESPGGSKNRRAATESSSGSSSAGRSRTTTGEPGDGTATAQLCASCGNGPAVTTTVNDVRTIRARTESAGQLRKIKVEVVAGFESESGPGTPLTSSSSAPPPTTRASHHRDHADRTRIRQHRKLRDLLDPPLTVEFLQMLLRHTLRYWHSWISQSAYTGRWRESVQRSAFTLKLMTYQPTGAVIAAPTFSLPEEIGGDRNWDYRYVWLRDSAFTIYAFIRLGLLSEARNYMRFIEMVFKDGGPPRVMYTIEGATEMPELELTHLDGYRGSKPVRIGNAASNHLQLDISGALLDAIYLMNKFSSPIGYDMWVVCAKLVDFVVENWQQPDMSIWEVRGKPVNFLYSKVMSWVAVDRGLRLVEKRMFPCPNRDKWFRTRDAIYLEIMEKGWNHEGRFFQQAYENAVLDSSVLIMPLVFFMSPTDPRLLSTIAAILRAPERGGLTVNNLVRRYQVGQVDDGFDSDEGAFTMCTLWLVEALTRAGQYYPKYLARALYAFDQTLAYGNHLLLFSEQVSPSGELVGNFPQAFTHIALISSAFNLDRVLGHRSVPDIV